MIVRIDYMPLSKKSTPKKIAKKIASKKVSKVEKETEMKLFTCKSCNKKFPDTGSYFYGKKSEKCLWCTKFPKSKK